jgi:hypothetical protein
MHMQAQKEHPSPTITGAHSATCRLEYVLEEGHGSQLVEGICEGRGTLWPHMIAAKAVHTQHTTPSPSCLQQCFLPERQDALEQASRHRLDNASCGHVLEGCQHASGCDGAAKRGSPCWSQVVVAKAEGMVRGMDPGGKRSQDTVVHAMGDDTRTRGCDTHTRFPAPQTPLTVPYLSVRRAVNSAIPGRRFTAPASPMALLLRLEANSQKDTTAGATAGWACRCMRSCSPHLGPLYDSSEQNVHLWPHSLEDSKCATASNSS